VLKPWRSRVVRNSSNAEAMDEGMVPVRA